MCFHLLYVGTVDNGSVSLGSDSAFFQKMKKRASLFWVLLELEGYTAQQNNSMKMTIDTGHYVISPKHQGQSIYSLDKGNWYTRARHYSFAVCWGY